MPFPAFLLRIDRTLAKQLFGLKDPAELRAALEKIDLAGPGILRVPHWQTLQQTLNEGHMEPDGGMLPRNLCLLGGRQLSRDPKLVVAMVRPDLVPHLAEELQGITRDTFHQWQKAYVDQAVHPDVREDELWTEFEALRQFYSEAAAATDAAAFVADLD